MAKYPSNYNHLLTKMTQRLISGLVLIFIIMAAFLTGAVGTQILLGLIAVLACSEWCALTRITQKKRARRFMLVMLFFGFLQIHFHYVYAGFGWLFLVCSGAMFMSWLTWRRGFFWMGAGFLYVGLPIFACLSLIAVFPKYMYVLVWAAIIAIANDTGGLVFGKLFAGPKLAPRISPKKTWAGLVGGAGFALLVGWYLHRRLSIEMPLSLFLLTNGLLALVSSLGDLFESALKRYHGFKDSGDIIPGHGGILDRLDGFFATILLLATMIYFYPEVFSQQLPDHDFPTVFLENVQNID
jgi:phosphatidate cytidylyltransferase